MKKNLKIDCVSSAKFEKMRPNRYFSNYLFVRRILMLQVGLATASRRANSNCPGKALRTFSHSPFDSFFYRSTVHFYKICGRTIANRILRYDDVLHISHCVQHLKTELSFSVPVTSVSVPGIDPECSVCCFYRRELFHFCHVSTFGNVMNCCCTGIKVEEQVVILLFGAICCTGPFSCSSLSKSLALDLNSLENDCCTFCSHHI